MFTKKFLLALLERGVKTFAQALAAILTAAGIGLIKTNWVGALDAAGMAALISVLTNIGIARFTDGGPSIGNVEEIAPDYGKYAAPEDGAPQPPDPAGPLVGPEPDPPVG